MDSAYFVYNKETGELKSFASLQEAYRYYWKDSGNFQLLKEIEVEVREKM